MSRAWVYPSDQYWINCLEEDKIIIEVGLNDFGNPDSIMVAEDCKKMKRFVFIEAKTSSYLENAMLNDQSSMLCACVSTLFKI